MDGLGLRTLKKGEFIDTYIFTIGYLNRVKPFLDQLCVDSIRRSVQNPDRTVIESL